MGGVVSQTRQEEYECLAAAAMNDFDYMALCEDEPDEQTLIIFSGIAGLEKRPSSSSNKLTIPRDRRCEGAGSVECSGLIALHGRKGAV
mmetsp:Transcript_76829/g.207272  ORF Transcript_76829/g.207272 Transcript_76829/m.207272 type:complete len:89 (-) Transcript_76829:674-940(-)